MQEKGKKKIKPVKKIRQSAHEKKSDMKNSENCLKSERENKYMPVNFSAFL